MRPAALFALAMTFPVLVSPRRERAEPVPAAAGLVVTADWLASHQGDPDLVILEVGEEADYKSGHVPGARPVNVMAFHSHGTGMPPAAHLVRAVEALGISNRSRIVLYGDIHGASIFWIMLEYLGMGDRAFQLDGGKFAWLAAGQKLTTEAPSYLARHFVPQLKPDIVVDAGWIVAHLKDPTLALIDARSAAEFAGTSHMSGERPGHIPGATNLDWEATLDGQRRFLSAHQLRALFARAGYAPGDQLVMYCTVGMRASHLYFVARHLGLTPRLYQGSMNDWASDPSRPVVRVESQ